MSSTTNFMIEDACKKKVTALRIYNGQAEVITFFFTVDLVNKLISIFNGMRCLLK